MDKPMNNCEMISRKWIQLRANHFNERSRSATPYLWQEIRAHDHLLHSKIALLERDVKDLNRDLADMLPVVKAAIAWLNAPIGPDIYRTQAALREATEAYVAKMEEEGE